jgi:hypothetical protein
MARKPSWSRRFPAPIYPLDGEPITTLLQAGEYLQGISAGCQRLNRWTHACALMIAAAEEGGDRKRMAAEAMGLLAGDQSANAGLSHSVVAPKKDVS